MKIKLLSLIGNKRVTKLPETGFLTGFDFDKFTLRVLAGFTVT
jgi:hypothetical protein